MATTANGDKSAAFAGEELLTLGLTLQSLTCRREKREGKEERWRRQEGMEEP